MPQHPHERLGQPGLRVRGEQQASGDRQRRVLGEPAISQQPGRVGGARRLDVVLNEPLVEVEQRRATGPRLVGVVPAVERQLLALGEGQATVLVADPQEHLVSRVGVHHAHARPHLEQENVIITAGQKS